MSGFSLPLSVLIPVGAFPLAVLIFFGQRLAFRLWHHLEVRRGRPIGGVELTRAMLYPGDIDDEEGERLARPLRVLGVVVWGYGILFALLVLATDIGAR